MERLGKIVVSTKLQSPHLVIYRITGRYYNDIQFIAIFLDMFQNIQAVSSGKIQIQKHTIIIIGSELIHSLIIVHGIFHYISLFLQGRSHQFLQRGLVFDDQKFHSQSL